MTELTQQIREQCTTQERECAALEGEQDRLKREILTIVDRMSNLDELKAKSEGRLKRLREENDALEQWLQVGGMLQCGNVCCPSSDMSWSSWCPSTTLSTPQKYEQEMQQAI